MKNPIFSNRKNHSLSQTRPQQHAALPTHQKIPCVALYCKVLKVGLQYYSVPQKRLQYYSLLQIPWLQKIFQPYFALHNTDLIVQKNYSSTTKYYSSIAKY